MSDDVALIADAGDLREVPGQNIALINDWRRHIEMWTQLQQQALEAGDQGEMNVRKAEHRLQTVRRLIDAEKSAASI